MRRKGTLFEDDGASESAADVVDDLEDLEDYLNIALDGPGVRRPPRTFKVRTLRGMRASVVLQEEEVADDDVDIWSEPPDNPNNIVVDPECGVKAANLNKLVERLTMVDDQDIVLQKTFIVTYRSFTTPEMLFRKLLQRYAMKVPHLPPSVSREEYHKLFVLPVQLRIINVVKQWMESSFFDFSDALISKLRRFINDVLIADNHTGFSRQLNNLLLKQLEDRQMEQKEQAEQDRITGSDTSAPETRRESYRKPPGAVGRGAVGPIDLETGGAPPASVQSQPAATAATLIGSAASGVPMQLDLTRRIAPSKAVSPASTLPQFSLATTDESIVPHSAIGVFQFSAEAIARQMTFFDFHYYRLIRPVELLNQSWTKNKPLAPNVLALIRRFNDTSLWATTMILSQKTAEARAAVWLRLVDIGDALGRLKNFNTLLALLSAFNKAAIHRLRQTKDLLPVAAR
jgi:hypothetical protein